MCAVLLAFGGCRMLSMRRIARRSRRFARHSVVVRTPVRAERVQPHRRQEPPGDHDGQHAKDRRLRFHGFYCTPHRFPLLQGTGQK
jgi:hypothetical protein